MKVISNRTFDKESASLNIFKENVEFKNCIFTEKCGLISILDSKASFRGCLLFTKVLTDNSRCTFHKCRFMNIGSEALAVQNSSFLEIDKSVFEKNGSRDVLNSQILLSDSHLRVEYSLITKGINAHAIEAFESSIEIENTDISHNGGCAMLLHTCEFHLESVRVSKNGDESGDFTQVYINSSKGEMIGSRVCEGINAGGIVVTKKSAVHIKNSMVYGHIKNGLAVECYSVVDMKGCTIYENGDEFEETLQVWVDNSKLSAKNCLIKNGVCGIYAQKGGYLELSNCKISDNIGGVCIFEGSNLTISRSVIKNNNSKPQLWLEGSKAEITGLAVNPLGCCEILHAEDMQQIHIKNCNIKRNDIVIKNCRNVQIDEN